MNAADVGAWHVIGLGLINESIVQILGGALEQSPLHTKVRGGYGIAALLATVLHVLEAGVWAAAYRLLRARPDYKSAMLYSLSALTSYGHANVFLERAVATDGCS